MVTVEFEQVSQKNDKNIVKRRVEEYEIVIESSQKYVGVEQNGEYRVFTTGVVKSIHNEKGTAMNCSEVNLSSKSGDVPSIVEVFAEDYGIIHGDVEDIL